MRIFPFINTITKYLVTIVEYSDFAHYDIDLTQTQAVGLEVEEFKEDSNEHARVVDDIYGPLQVLHLLPSHYTNKIANSQHRGSGSYLDGINFNEHTEINCIAQCKIFRGKIITLILQGIVICEVGPFFQESEFILESESVDVFLDSESTPWRRGFLIAGVG